MNKLAETIFRYITEGSVTIDTKLLEEQFNVKQNKALTMRKKEKTVQVLDLKRANTIGILIHRLKAPVDEIVDALISLDEHKLSLDNTRNLLKMAPTDDEVNFFLIGRF